MASTAAEVPSVPDITDEETAITSNIDRELQQAANEAEEESEHATDDDKKVVKDIAYYKQEAKKEKAGKRRLFQSLVKLAEELKRVRAESRPLQVNAAYANQTWYEGGLWRAPQLLPGVDQGLVAGQRARPRAPVSLSDLFFNLVVVTAFTRVGVAITNSGQVTASSLLYFAAFWIIWSKEASYSTRFDTTDLSAKAGTLVTCFAVLFASLSVSTSMESDGSIRIMMTTAFCSLLHCGYMARVYLWHRDAEPNTLEDHVRSYALYHTIMNLIETITWTVGIFIVPSQYRWIIFTIGILLGLRIPRAFLSNDFHGKVLLFLFLFFLERRNRPLDIGNIVFSLRYDSRCFFHFLSLPFDPFLFLSLAKRVAACTKRGVLFILLLGFMLQSVVVISTDFFEFTIPDLEQYSFIGASCLLLFCIKLLYVDDSSTLATDHALLVNRTAALCFNLGQFALLFSTTILGSGLHLLTHSYLAAAAALPDNAKNMVCGGFAAVVFFTALIKSMHLKRVPTSGRQRTLFLGAYALQGIATLAVVFISLTMCYNNYVGGYLQVLMQNDIALLYTLSGFAFFLVVLSWLDEGLELSLQESMMNNGDTEEEYLVHPFGFWWCLQPEVDMDDIIADTAAAAAGRSSSNGADIGGMQRSSTASTSGARLSELSPLLGESIAKNLRMSTKL